MTESAMAVVKPEMKSYIWLQTADGSIQQVEEEVAMFCPMICREILQTGMGSSKNYAISLPQRVNPAILGLILDYCRFHQVPGRSNKERKTFDEKFIRMDTKKLCELTSAADSLQLKPLVDLTSRALARIIEGKTPEEIRETFHLPDDLTEEEKLEPLRNITDDPRIRLLNRLYARKRKELREREKLKNVEIEERVDDRSVDDLLSFINGVDGDSKAVKTNKNKKKNRRRKDQQKDSSSTNENGNHDKIGELDALPSCCQNNEFNKILGASPSRTVKSQDSAAAIYSPKIEFDDADIYDDLDPAMKEELDREVEDFARRLNSDWPERVQEILSLGQERKLVTVLNGNGSSPRFTRTLSLQVNGSSTLLLRGLRMVRDASRKLLLAGCSVVRRVKNVKALDLHDHHRRSGSNQSKVEWKKNPPVEVEWDSLETMRLIIEEEENLMEVDLLAKEIVLSQSFYLGGA